jgi:hypothetical protein
MLTSLSLAVFNHGRKHAMLSSDQVKEFDTLLPSQSRLYGANILASVLVLFPRLKFSLQIVTASTVTY